CDCFDMIRLVVERCHPKRDPKDLASAFDKDFSRGALLKMTALTFVRRFLTFALLFCAAQRADAFSSPLVVFGDSLSDVGNVNNQTFGISPGSGYWNGRFSNGPVWAESLATGLSLSAPTYSRGGGSDWAYGGAHTG